MNAQFVLPIFAVLLAMVITWFVTLSWFFRRLRTRHAETYESLGSPSLFWNNSPRHNWLYLKFLFSSRWRVLDDPSIGRAVRFMRIFLGVYVLLLIAVAVLAFTADLR